jgi:hypothetical protein
MIHRMILDGEGTVWDVWEVLPSTGEKRLDDNPVPPPDTPERRRSRGRTPRRAGWLAIQNEMERRRVVPAPAAWSDMTDDELRAVIAASAGTGRRLRHDEE